MDGFSVPVMAVGWISPEHPVAEAMTAIGAALDGVAKSPVWSLRDGQVEDLLDGAHRLEGRLAELTARLVEEADRRELAKRAGASSTRAWLRHRWQVAPAEAKRQVSLASGLGSGLDTTRAALAAGEITRAHAGVIVQVMDTQPAGLCDEALEAAERQLVGWCRQFDPVEVVRLGRRLWEVVDPDGADAREAELLKRQERGAKRQRHLSFRPDGFGRHALRGQFDTEASRRTRS